MFLFQSTLPGWGATGHWDCSFHSGFRFQSTLPGWGATSHPTGIISYPKFQSTLPGWGATWACHTSPSSYSYFNPRSPDGERPGRDHDWREAVRISIHAPRMGSDYPSSTWPDHRPGFQSTLPGWGATDDRGYCSKALKFQSTLPGWGATSTVDYSATRMDFNPRSPDGERPD